jgi:hypothetical protein
MLGCMILILRYILILCPTIIICKGIRRGLHSPIVNLSG